MARDFVRPDHIVKFLFCFSLAEMAKENVRFRELRNWDLMP
jgi:hypothetical protein